MKIIEIPPKITNSFFLFDLYRTTYTKGSKLTNSW